MFDPGFYRSVLPDRVTTECKRRPGMVPQVEFRLNDGSTLDVCHIVFLSEGWLAVAHFRNVEECDDMDFTFVPYESVVRVHIIMHPHQRRRLGFDVEKTQRREEDHDDSSTTREA